MLYYILKSNHFWMTLFGLSRKWMCVFASKSVTINRYCLDFYQNHKQFCLGIIFRNDHWVHRFSFIKIILCFRSVCNPAPPSIQQCLFYLRSPKCGYYSTSDELSCSWIILQVTTSQNWSVNIIFEINHWLLTLLGHFYFYQIYNTY